MLRRLVFLSALIYSVFQLTQSKAKRRGNHPDAAARWDSEGGAQARKSA
jgi:hypothetical protein